MTTSEPGAPEKLEKIRDEPIKAANSDGYGLRPALTAPTPDAKLTLEFSVPFAALQQP